METQAPEAAVLMIPEDVYTTELKLTTHLREYIQKNVVQWYRFVKHTLGYDITNGNLHVVHGCCKTSGFGIATVFNTGERQNTRLSFLVEDPRPGTSTCPYRWKYTGTAEVKAGPDTVEISSTEPVRNQCLFVRTINSMLSNEIWKSVELDTVM